MITEQVYKQALEDEKAARNIINRYHQEKMEAFDKRMKENPIFTDDELFYSARNLCPCGYGLAYPKNCGGHHYWDCSAILKGIQDNSVEHTGQLPFVCYNIKGESEHRGSTRGVFVPEKKGG